MTHAALVPFRSPLADDGPRVLVVDDDEALASAYGEALAAAGYRPVLAYDGAAALRALDVPGDVPRLAIVDALMPGMMGDALCARLRERHGRADLPIFFLTGFSHHTRDLGLWRRLTGELEVDLVLSKPVAPAELVERAREVLSGGAPGPSRRRGRSDLKAQQRGRFLAAADEHRVRLQSLVDAVLREDGPESRSALTGFARKLKQRAGGLGLSDLATLATVVERACEVGAWGDAELLPILVTRLGRALVAARDAAAGACGEDETPGLRILLVDPDVDFCSRVTDAAERTGARVRAAPDPAQVGWVVDDFRPDVVAFSDGVRGADPLHLCRQVVGRGAAGAAGGPLVLLMGNDDGLRQRLAVVRAGATAFIERPVSAERFLSSVTRLVEQRRSRWGTVVIADDDPETVAMLRGVLEAEGLRVMDCARPDRFLETLAAVRPEVVLLSAEMPIVGGFDLCRVVRADARYTRVTLMLMGRHREVVDRVAAFECGADDFVGLPVSADELAARVVGRLRRARETARLRARDALTDLLDAETFQARLAAEVASAAREGRVFTVATLSVANLSYINRQYGHDAGDAALRSLGDLLRSSFRSSDVAARVAGNRFALLLLGADARVLKGVLGATLDELNARVVAAPEGARVRARCVAGLASFPRDEATAAGLWDVAERERAAAAEREREA